MAASKAQEKSVALLRGVNVGGANRLAMKDLVALFHACGCEDVATYIQSGNVVFRAPGGKKIEAAALAEKIKKKFGIAVPVVLRTASEIDAIVRANAFPKCDPDRDRLHVSFLASEPTNEQIASLDPNRSPGDSFIVRGREIYLLFPNGAGNTKLTSQYLDSRLKTTGTARNWRTVLKIQEMLKA